MGTNRKAQEVVCHALFKDLVGRSCALKKLFEVRVGEELAGGDRVEIAIIGAVDLRNRIQPKLGDGIQKIGHRSVSDAVIWDVFPRWEGRTIVEPLAAVTVLPAVPSETETLPESVSVARNAVRRGGHIDGVDC